jgi:hypothetical protein
MKSMRTVLIGTLALLTAAPPATAQHILRMPASGHKPGVTFAKDLTPAAPIPRLDLSPIFAALPQDPDPTGLIGKAGEAAEEGVNKWYVAALATVGIGGAMIYYGRELDEEYGSDSDGEAIMLSGGAVALIGAVMWIIGDITADRGQIWLGKTRGGIAGGVRIPIGRR